jgi:hypothetical protein
MATCGVVGLSIVAAGLDAGATGWLDVAWEAAAGWAGPGGAFVSLVLSQPTSHIAQTKDAHAVAIFM